MFKSMRNYFRLLAEGYENGALSHALYPFLEVSGALYGSAVGTIRFLHEKGILARKKLPFPVISVGNLTWGGTGKTPLVEFLARRGVERNRVPLILTRGYNHDEVEQFRNHLPKEVVIGVGKDRSEVARKIAKDRRIDFAILDDGLQHWPVERNVEMITVNALNPFGNGKLLPRGILREPLAILKRAAVIVMSHSNLLPPKELGALKEKIHGLAPQAFVAESWFEPLFFYRARKRARVPLERLAHQKVTTFSGLGTPRSFQLLLSRLQIKPVRNFEFEDHHLYSEKELWEIKHVSESSSVAEIITTEKDFYRLPGKISDILNPLVLATRLRISSGEEDLTDRLFRLLDTKPS